MAIENTPYVCPAEFSGSLDNSFRRMLHNPKKILTPYIKPGMTVIDLGCGPGVFTVEIARLLSGSGKVIAADIQEGMLKIVAEKVNGTDHQNKVVLHKCEQNKTGLTERADFILAFWVIHEIPDHNSLFGELAELLNPGGKILIAEPRLHVTASDFRKMKRIIENTGFEFAENPGVFFSRTLLLNLPD
jgi:ubiquinone/menaquinone biosynthesis C-methylase UbiE